MASFNIKEDLTHRADAQALEIIAISGPGAEKVMISLRDKKFSWIEERYGLKVDPTVAAGIVLKYARSIIR